MGNNSLSAKFSITGFLKVIIVLVVTFLLLFSFSVDARAEETMLSDYSSDILFSQEFYHPGAEVQSICVTEDYIFTIENTSFETTDADIISKYYRNSVDENGNAVTQYDLASQNGTLDLEAAKSMAYDPDTKKIVVAAYSNLDPENRGCLFILDPETLEITDKVKVSDAYNILTISYDREKKQYTAMTNDEYGYSLLTLNSNFEVTEEKGPLDPTPGFAFRGGCSAGDLFLVSPVTEGLEIGRFINAYSISGMSLQDSVPFNPPIEGAVSIETQAIARLDDTSFVLVVNAKREDTSGVAYFYRLQFPHLTGLPALFGNAQDDAAKADGTEEKEDEVKISKNRSSMKNVSTPEVTQTISQSTTVPIETNNVEEPFDIMPVIIAIVIIGGVVAVFFVVMLKIKGDRKKRELSIKEARSKTLEEYRKEVDDFKP